MATPLSKLKDNNRIEEYFFIESWQRKSDE